MIPRFHLLTMFALVVVSAAFGAVMHWRLPETVPTHWNIHGQADGWGGKWQLTVLFPALNAGIVLLLVALPLLGPFRANFEKFRVAYGRIGIVIVAALTAMDVVFLLKADGATFDLGSALCVVIGLMLALMGNWLGKVRRNFYVGIRTPWTLANEDVWERTHRVGAKLFVAQGLLAAVVGLLAPSFVCFIVLIGGILAVTLWTILYSYLLYRRMGQVDEL